MSADWLSPPATPLEWRLLGAESAWYTEHRVDQDLPQLATDALIAGIDSQSLRVLAGESADAFPYDLGELLAASLIELGRPPPAAQDAWRGFVAFRCWEVATGLVDPARGAAHLEAIGYVQSDQPRDARDVVLEFSSLDDQWHGDWARPKPVIEREIGELAAAVVARYLARDRLAPEPEPEPEPPLTRRERRWEARQQRPPSAWERAVTRLRRAARRRRR